MSDSKNTVINQRDYAPLKRSQRIITLATKVTPHFDETFRRLAQKKQMLITELLEDMIAVYLEQEKIKEEAQEVAKSKVAVKKK